MRKKERKKKQTKCQCTCGGNSWELCQHTRQQHCCCLQLLTTPRSNQEGRLHTLGHRIDCGLAVLLLRYYFHFISQPQYSLCTKHNVKLYSCCFFFTTCLYDAPQQSIAHHTSFGTQLQGSLIEDVIKKKKKKQHITRVLNWTESRTDTVPDCFSGHNLQLGCLYGMHHHMPNRANVQRHQSFGRCNFLASDSQPFFFSTIAVPKQN